MSVCSKEEKTFRNTPVELYQQHVRLGRRNLDEGGREMVVGGHGECEDGDGGRETRRNRAMVGI